MGDPLKLLVSPVTDALLDKFALPSEARLGQDVSLDLVGMLCLVEILKLMLYQDSEIVISSRFVNL